MLTVPKVHKDMRAERRKDVKRLDTAVTVASTAAQPLLTAFLKFRHEVNGSRFKHTFVAPGGGMFTRDWKSNFSKLGLTLQPSVLSEDARNDADGFGAEIVEVDDEDLPEKLMPGLVVEAIAGNDVLKKTFLEIMNLIIGKRVQLTFVSSKVHFVANLASDDD